MQIWQNGGECMALRLVGDRRLCALCLVLAVLAGGCNAEDTERMARVGRKLITRAEALTTEEGGLHKSWEVVRNGWQETTLAGRVAARLRWDKKLADCQIQVSTAGNVIELKGLVRDLEQRRRALDLAESTTGAEKAIDALEIAAP
jgi:hypothetical protein